MSDEQKRAVGRRAADLIENDMTVGLGTGSTANHFLDRLGERIRDESLVIRGVPTSERTARRAEALGVRLVTLADFPRLDIAIDGADQVDPRGNLIKGLGGALYREKRVARAATGLVIIVDAGKMVDRLGVGCPVPVEVERGRAESSAGGLRELGASPALRRDGDSPYVTDNGNWILDADFGAIPEPANLERRINDLPGVLDSGLFCGMTTRVLIAEESGVREWTPGPREQSESPER